MRLVGLSRRVSLDRTARGSFRVPIIPSFLHSVYAIGRMEIKETLKLTERY